MFFTGQSLQEVNPFRWGERPTVHNFSSKGWFSVKLSQKVFFRSRGIFPCVGATSIVAPKAQKSFSFQLRVLSFWAVFFLVLKMSFMVENAFQGLSGVKNNLSKDSLVKKISTDYFFFFFGLSINNFFWLHFVFIENILSEPKHSLHKQVD